MVRQTRSKTKQQEVEKQSTNISKEASVSDVIQKPNKVEKHQKRPHISDDSSSESDIENYLKPAHEIDLNSTFFDIPKAEKQFNEIEKSILSDVKPLSDSDLSEDDAPNEKEREAAIAIQTHNFQQMQEQLQKIEEAKRHIREYEARKQTQNKKTKKKIKTEETVTTNIADLLSVGEKLTKDETTAASSLDSEDFTSMSESEREDWEEVKEATEKNIVPKQGVQITVQMPGVIREKKGVDLVAAMKRRLNRIKKENQVLIHKVHLLCWIAHGNYVNRTANSEKFLGLTLSLIPSEQCYPTERTDLNYLEQILNWYRKTVVHLDQRDDGKYDLETKLHIDISRKQASNKRILVLIFICILRSLGIQCRLVMSLLVQPLRPPGSELCSLSTKKDEKKGGHKKKAAENTENVDVIAADKDISTKKHEKKGGHKKRTAENTENVDVISAEKNRIVKIKSVEGIDLKKDKNVKNDTRSKTVKNQTEKQSPKKDGDVKKNKRAAAKDSKAVKSEASSNKKLPNKSNNSKSKHATIGGKLKTSQKTSATKKVFFSNLTGNKDVSPSIAQNSQDGKTKPNLTKIQMSLRLKKSDDTTVKTKSSEQRGKNKNIPQADGANDSDADQASSSKVIRKPNLKKIKEASGSVVKDQKRRLRSLPDYKDIDSEEEFCPRNPFVKKNSQPTVNLSKLKKFTKRSNSASPRKMDVRNDIIHLIKGRILEEKQNAKVKLVKSSRSKLQSDDDSDYCPESINKKKHDSDDEFIANLKPKVKRRVQVKDENNGEEEQKKKGNDIWVEVYLEAEEKWISVDVVRKQVHCVNEIYKRATQPVSYILTWDNKNYIKDLTKRYCPNWNTVTRKLRVDPKWWDDTVKPFTGPKTARDRDEDEELARLQLEKPLPTTISEYKNHPLYALKRHLLKFEAIYPPDAVTLGFVRNEPVYARDCVHTLHSREIWLKHAKVVRPGEKPYKIVKARPKYDKLSNTVITDQPLEIFGKWQVDDYVPPTAENGVVPRNEYGNVELFKACMLPKGTVHLQLPGLNKVAKKLNIDCASAVVGFDFHSGWSHPMFDGFVVCEEYKDTLTAAWEQEQEEAEKRAQEKIEKRVYDNWKRLIKGLLIRERLKAKYDFGAPSTSASNKQKRKAKPTTLVVKKKR